MLTDSHVNSASAIIKQDFPDIKGLQSTLNAQRQKGFKPAEEGSIQVLHCGDNYQHWVTTCFMAGQVLLYDSLGQAKAALTPGLKKQIIELWNNSWWRRSSKRSSAPGTEAIWKDRLWMFCNCLGCASCLLWQAWNYNTGPNKASFSSRGMSAQATVYSLSAHYQKDTAYTLTNTFY